MVPSLPDDWNERVIEVKTVLREAIACKERPYRAGWGV
jgi:hypothetical protein